MTLPVADVPSPCINVCTMNDSTGLCNGCWRTLDEIAWWSQLDDDDKRAVWLALRQRREAVAVGSTPATTGPV
jgi:uncharacterized protein